MQARYAAIMQAVCMAPNRKPAHLRGPRTGSHTKNPAVAELTLVEGFDPPPALPSWLKPTKQSWDEFWSHPLAKTVEAVDVPALERLFTMRDMQSRAWRRYKKQPYIDGSQGQPVANPAFGEAMSLERAIVALEDRIGLTGKARANLGVALGQAALTAADLNRAAKDADADHDDAIEVASWEPAQPGAAGL